MGPDNYPAWLQGGVVAGIGSIIGSLLYLRRRVSKDNVAIAGDKGEIARVKNITVVDASLVAERDRAQKGEEDAWKLYNTLVIEVGGLRASNQYLKEENERLNTRVRRLEGKLGISFNSTDLKG